MNMNLLLHTAILFVCLAQVDGRAAETPLELWAGHWKMDKSGQVHLSRPPATNHPPVCLTAYFKRSGQRSLLAFRLTNCSKLVLRFDRWDLPWSQPYSISLAALTTDGALVPNCYPIADRPVEISGTDLTLRPGASIEGDYDIQWGVKLDKAPKGKDLLVLWSYETPRYLKLPESRCTGVVIIPSN